MSNIELVKFKSGSYGLRRREPITEFWEFFNPATNDWTSKHAYCELNLTKALSLKSVLEMANTIENDMGEPVDE